jgi:hypothetical protein
MPAAFRFVGVAFAKTFTKIFGIATITFLGRVPSRDDDKIALVGLLSITWFALLVVLVVPSAAELVMPGLPDDDTLVRFLAAGAALLLPLVNGLVVSRVHNQQGSLIRHLGLGFVYSSVIGALVLGIIVTVPIVRGSYLVRRFDVKNLAVMVGEDAYEDVLEAIRTALHEEGIETEVSETNPALRRMFGGLAWVLGRIFRREHIAHDMRSVTGTLPGGDDFEIILHATDISIIGHKRETTAVAAVLSERLEHPQLYFSWDDDSQEVEDRIEELRDNVHNGGSVNDDEIDRLRRRLRDVELSTEEWNAIRRLLYRLEVERLRAERGVSSRR